MSDWIALLFGALVVIVFGYFIARFVDNLIGYNVFAILCITVCVVCAGLYTFDVVQVEQSRLGRIQSFEIKNIEASDNAGKEKLDIIISGMRQHLESYEHDLENRQIHLRGLGNSVDRIFNDLEVLDAVKRLRTLPDNETWITLKVIINQMEHLGIERNMDLLRLKELFEINP